MQSASVSNHDPKEVASRFKHINSLKSQSQVIDSKKKQITRSIGYTLKCLHDEI